MPRQEDVEGQKGDVMGQRGPAKTPTSILAARGSWRADNRASGPEPFAKCPDPPADMPESAQYVWIELAPELVGMQVLSQPNMPAFRLMVECIDAYRRTYAESLVTPFTVETDRCGPKEHPIHKMADRLRADGMRWLSKFGMTPADASDVLKGGGEKPQGLAGFALTQRN